MWRTLLMTMLGASLAYGADKFVKMSIPTNSYGTIRGTGTKANTIYGTGFAISSSNIITCEHVVAMLPGSSQFRYSTKRTNVPVTLEKTFPRYDLAVLKTDSTNTIFPFPYGDIRRIRPGDEVVYIGFNTNSMSLHASKAEVSAVGVALHNGVTVDFLEFKGEGRPGYSGGPILNHKGEVVALMTQAWNRRGVKGTNELLFNRGFSIEPVMLSKEIYYPASPSTNTFGTNTISIGLEE